MSSEDIATIIGHRGAAGVALENTLPSFRKAAALGVQTVEFDVRLTRDEQFVVCHDDSLNRVSDTNKRIKELTYSELKDIELHNGARVPLLVEVLQFARKKQLAVIVELKIRHNLEALCAVLDDYQDLSVTIASFKHDTLAAIRKLRPTFKIYLAEAHHPIEVLQKARAIKAQGIDLNYKLLNPFTYWIAQHWKLQLMVYTVNSPFMYRCIRFLYPNVLVCTDHPQRFIRPPK